MGVTISLVKVACSAGNIYVKDVGTESISITSTYTKKAYTKILVLVVLMLKVLVSELSQYLLLGINWFCI